MSKVTEHPLKEEYSTRGSALNHGNSLVSGGSSKTSSDNDVSNQSKTVNTTGPSFPQYRELMETLEEAKSFCRKYKINLIKLNNQTAEKQFILDLYEKCPNRGEKPIKDILEVMIDVLRKYFIGFNTIPMLGRKSYSGHDESIMITCVKYLFGIVTKEKLVSSSKLYSSEELTRSQCRVRLLHFYKGLKKKIMPAEEFLLILDIKLVIEEESDPVKF